jgi:hypothetical protein
VISAEVELEVTKSFISPHPVLAIACLPPSSVLLSTAAGVRLVSLAPADA